MPRTTDKQLAEFETTRRLLACLINEGLVNTATKSFGSSQAVQLILTPSVQNDVEMPISQVTLGFHYDSPENEADGYIRLPVDPGRCRLPVKLEGTSGHPSSETNPSRILNAIRQWLPGRSAEVDTATAMLQNCADNQERWLLFHKYQSACNLDSSSTDWEHTITGGHPQHPFHRCFYPTSPLLPQAPLATEEFLSPDISFISVPDTKLSIIGPFREIFQPLLQRLGLSELEAGRTIIPCFTRQWPLISAHLPRAILVRSVPRMANTLLSTRTVSISPEFNFHYHVKMSLSYQVTAAVRSVKPWQAKESTYMTELIERLAHPNLWVYREVATVTGADMEIEVARTFSCILREDLEPRATAEGQALVVSAALYQRPFGESRTYAEILFNLNSMEEKCTWVRSYTSLLFEAVMPLLGLGVALEPHGQNLVVRIDKKDKYIRGLAIRDMNGIKLHLPTLQDQGIAVPEELIHIPEIRQEKIEKLWQKVHRTAIQVNITAILRGLGLDNSQGWAIVREELDKVLLGPKCPMGLRIREFFRAPTMATPCCMGAILRGDPLDFRDKQLPNSLLQ